MEDKRNFMRIKFLADIELVFNGKIYEADLLDLSLNGALMQPRNEMPLKVGDLCYLRIGLSDKSLILEFNAELIHKQKSNLGFKFISMDLDTMTHLRRLLELNLCDHDRVTHELAFLAST